MEQDEQEVIDEHCSPELADAMNSPPVEIDSDQHHKAATVPPEGRDSAGYVSSNVHRGQQEVPEEHDHANSHSPGLANVPPVGSEGEIIHIDVDLHHYPRQSHQPPQCYNDYVLR